MSFSVLYCIHVQYIFLVTFCYKIKNERKIIMMIFALDLLFSSVNVPDKIILTYILYHVVFFSPLGTIENRRSLLFSLL